MTSARPRSLPPFDTSHLHIPLGVSTSPPRVAAGRIPPATTAVIVDRWRRLGTSRRDGSTYHGCRLPPSLWRAVDGALTSRPDLLSLSAHDVAALLPRVRAASKATRAPARTQVVTIAPQTLLTLLRFLARRDRLARILEAHRETARPRVTDLLLYRVRKGRAVDFHFIVARRDEERVSTAQVVEIELLRSLGLQAGIVRLHAPGAEPELTLSPDILEMIDQSVDAEMERWARSLLIVMDGEVRKLNEEEVQLAIGRPAPRGAPVRRRARGGLTRPGTS